MSSNKIIVGLGDCHFSTRKKYYPKAFEYFIEWFDGLDFGVPKEDAVLVIAGDIFNSINICTSEAAMFDKFINSARKKVCQVIVNKGNHDEGLVGYEVDDITEFLESKGIICQKVVQRVKLDNGMECVFAPFSNAYAKDYQYLAECIANAGVAPAIVLHYDIHPFGGEPLALNYYDASKIIGGHIHTRKDGEEYCGSIIACSKDDDRLTYCSVIKIIQSQGENYEIPIPNFVRFDQVLVESFKDSNSLAEYLNNKGKEYQDKNCVYQACLRYDSASKPLLKALRDVEKDLIYDAVNTEIPASSENNDSDEEEITQDISNKEDVVMLYFSQHNENNELKEYCLSKVRGKDKDE